MFVDHSVIVLFIQKFIYDLKFYFFIFCIFR